MKPLPEPGPDIAPWCGQCAEMYKCDADGCCAVCGVDLLSAKSYNELRRRAEIEALEVLLKAAAWADAPKAIIRAEIERRKSESGIKPSDGGGR